MQVAHTPAALYKDLSEDHHQSIVVQWLDLKNIYYEVSINGIFLPNPHPKNSKAWIRQRNANNKVLQKHKRLGYEKGIADLKIYLPQIELNIELKKIGGKPTPEQLENVERFKTCKYAVFVIIEGYKEAIKYIESHLG